MGLYEGMGARAVQCFIEDFVFFWWYSSVKTRATELLAKGGVPRPLTIAQGLGVGAVAGIVNNASTIPFDVVATNYQISGIKEGKSLYATMCDVYNNGGVSAFWSGLGPSCLLVINPAINFAAFDRLKLVYNKTKHRRSGITGMEAASAPLAPLEAFVLGALSKGIATAITFPMIRLKVLMMHSEKGGGGEGEGKKKVTALEMLQHTVANEGVAGLYKGLGVQLGRSTVAAAIMFMTREQLNELTAGTLRRLRTAAATAK